jgi:hypothetical protein
MSIEKFIDEQISKAIKAGEFADLPHVGAALRRRPSSENLVGCQRRAATERRPYM